MIVSDYLSNVFTFAQYLLLQHHNTIYMKHTSPLIVLFSFAIQLVFSQTQVEQLIKNSLLENANISLLVRNLKTGETVSELNQQKAAVTASTMKVITTATFLEMYGPDFRFETRLEIDGRIEKDSTLNGNLYIRGGGDPTLGSAKAGDKDFLEKWVAAVKKAGIKKINGGVIADPGLFDQQVINPKWTWEDMGNYYAPGIHGISYLDNTYQLFFNSGKAGKLTETIRTEPAIKGLVIDNFVKSANISFDNAYFYGAPFSYHRFVTGEIPANKSGFVVKGDIPDPALLLAQHFSEKLIASGAVITDTPTVKSNISCRKFSIYTHLSAPLSEVITETNIKSNNHYAEYLFKYIATRTQEIGTFEEAIQNIRAFWKSKGLPVDELFQADGSGLSPVNAVSARFFVELLTYMQNKSKYADVFYKSLPVSGESGTLKSFLDKTSLQGKVHAKSGTIARVKSYVGYIECPDKTLVFALLINNANGTSREVTKKIEEILLQVSK